MNRKYVLHLDQFMGYNKCLLCGRGLQFFHT
uniref:Uncharacterized protein n=1 Tax=Anguilla anguilla TaxID=7936 RepID=A0A0E9S425_ANGAN